MKNIIIVYVIFALSQFAFVDNNEGDKKLTKEEVHNLIMGE